jgi:hypothetical protein
VAPGYTFGAQWADVSLIDYQAHSNTGGILNAGESIAGASFTAASAYESGSMQSLSAFTLHGTKEVQDKTFVNMKGIWFDTSCRSNESTKDVEFGSAAYLKLLRDDNDSTYLGAGTDMVVCSGNHTLRIFTNNTKDISFQNLTNMTGLNLTGKSKTTVSISPITPTTSNITSTVTPATSSADEGIKTQEADNILDMVIEFFKNLMKVI